MRTKSEGNSCEPSEAHNESFAPTTLDDWGDVKPRSPGTALDQLAARSVQIPLTIYDARNIRNNEQNIFGGIHTHSDGESLVNGSPIIFESGTGRVMLIVNAGTDTSGVITVTGDTVDRISGVVTVDDTEEITVAGLSVDTSSVDGDGNVIHELSNCPLTEKWFTGATVTLSTATTGAGGVDLSDVDVKHLSYNQMNDQAGLTLLTLDAYLHTTNNSAEFHVHLYTVKAENGTVAISHVAGIDIDGGDALAEEHWRLRKANLAVPLDGSDGEGFFFDQFIGPTGTQYIDDGMVILWVNVAQSSGTNAGGPFLLRSQGDFGTFDAKATPVDADILLIEDSADSGAKKKVTLGDLPGSGSADAVTAAAVLAADVIPVGDGARGLVDNNFGIALVDGTLFGVTEFRNGADRLLLRLFSTGISGGIVNNLFTGGHITGFNPFLAAEGSDTDVGLTFITQNAGTLELEADTNIDGDLGVTGTVAAPEIANVSGDLKIEPDVQGDVVLFGDTDVGDAVNGKSLYVWRKALEGDNYLRLHITAASVAKLVTDTQLFIDASGYVKIVAGNHIYLDLNDNAGSHKLHVRDSDKNDVATIDSNGNFELAGTVDGVDIAAHATAFVDHAADSANPHVVKLDDLAAPDDNTDLDVSITLHGLCPKAPNDATKYLDGTGAYTVPAGGGGGTSGEFHRVMFAQAEDFAVNMF